MKKSFDVGFIGSGFAAEFHLAALRKVYDVKIQVVGAYSPTKSNLEEFCTKQALEAFSSAEELISRVDVVHICTPPSTHESLCIQALKQHRQVIVEKPLTGYFGEEADDFSGDTFPREKGFEKAVQSLQNILKAEKESDGQIFMLKTGFMHRPFRRKKK